MYLVMVMVLYLVMVLVSVHGDGVFINTVNVVTLVMLPNTKSQRCFIVIFPLNPVSTPSGTDVTTISFVFIK